MRTLIIAPHADDESISCGGLIQKRLQDGHQVYILVVHGRVYDYGKQSVEMTREEEEDDFRSAKEILGVRLSQCLNLIEGEPSQLGYYKALQPIEYVMQNFDPHEIIVPGAAHLNQDHRFLSHVLGIALRPVNLRNVNRVLEFLPLDGTVQTPNHFIGITQEQMEHKLEAIAAYRRESRVSGPRAEQNVMAQAMVWGAMSGHALAEAYRTVFSRE